MIGSPTGGGGGVSHRGGTGVGPQWGTSFKFEYQCDFEFQIEMCLGYERQGVGGCVLARKNHVHKCKVRGLIRPQLYKLGLKIRRTKNLSTVSEHSLVYTH
jgi:hypothetical protein